jgi:hypothetical protein
VNSSNFLNILDLNWDVEFFIFLLVFFGLLLIIFLFIIRYRLDTKKHEQAIQQRINFYLVYRINLKLDMVYELDPKHPNQDRMIPVSKFLKRFSSLEAEKMYQWWESLIRAKLDTPWILTTQALRSPNGKSRQMIFEVVKIDETKQVLHFHQYALKYLKPSNKKYTAKQIIVSSQQALQLVKKMPPKQGVLFSFHILFPRKGLDEQFKYFYLSQCKEKILPYLSPQLILIDTAQDILILATKLIENHAYMQIAETFKRVITQYIELNALESLIRFNLAIVEHQHFPNDLRTLIRKAKDLNQIILKRKVPIGIFEKNQPLTQTLEKNESLFAHEFYRELKFDLLYRPMIQVPEVEISAHQVMIHPFSGNPLSSFELLNEAPLMVDYPKEFYRRYLYLVQQLLSQTTKPLLVPFSLAMKSSDYHQEFLTYTNTDKLWVYLDEFEVKELATNIHTLKSWAEPLKRLGCQFVLGLDDITVNLESSIYAFVDYLVMDYRRMVNLEDEQKTSIQLKILFQNYAPFQKPFIITDIISEAAMDGLPFKHVKIIGADWMMGYQPQLEVPSKRQMLRLKNLITKQEKVYGKTN